MTTAQDVIRQAERWVGFVERPTNRTPFGVWYGLDGQPYCAMALSMWSFDAGLPIPASSAKGYAYTPSGAAWFRQRGRWGSTPRKGAHVFFQFSGPRIHHVGLVISDDGVFPIDTIEANTSRGAAGSQRDGGGVWRRRRATGIVGYGYPAYEESSTTEEDPVLVPIDILAGKDKVLHIEPTGGHIGLKEPLLVLATHGSAKTPLWVWRQNGGGPGEVLLEGGKPLVLPCAHGWVHIENRGKATVGGHLLYRRL